MGTHWEARHVAVLPGERAAGRAEPAKDPQGSETELGMVRRGWCSVQVVMVLQRSRSAD